MTGLYINARRDAEAGIFYVETNVPGLNVEAESLEAMVEILEDVLPDLIRSNVPAPKGEQTRVRFFTDLAFA